MRELLAQMVQTKEVIEANAKQIARLQKELIRLQKDGADVSQVEALISQFHTLHVHALAVQSLLQKTLKALGDE